MDKTQKLKNIILNRYGSIREFAKVAGIPSTTLTSALDKGIGGMAVDRIIKICEVLDIDVKTFDENVSARESKGHSFEQYLSKLGFEIIYDDVNGYLILDTSDSQYEISPYDIDNLQDNVESYIKFKISEITKNLRKFPKKLGNIPIAAHNDFEDDKEQQKLMREDLDEL